MSPRLIPVGSIDSFTPVHSALQLSHLSRSTPVGSIVSQLRPQRSTATSRLYRPCRLIPVGSIHHALLCRSARGLMSSGSQARTLRREAASLFASRSREADDSVLVKTERACDVSRVVRCARFASAVLRNAFRSRRAERSTLLNAASTKHRAPFARSDRELR